MEASNSRRIQCQPWLRYSSCDRAGQRLSGRRSPRAALSRCRGSWRGAARSRPEMTSILRANAAEPNLSPWDAREQPIRGSHLICVDLKVAGFNVDRDKLVFIGLFKSRPNVAI